MGLDWDDPKKAAISAPPLRPFSLATSVVVIISIERAGIWKEAINDRHIQYYTSEFNINFTHGLPLAKSMVKPQWPLDSSRVGVAGSIDSSRPYRSESSHKSMGWEGEREKGLLDIRIKCDGCTIMKYFHLVGPHSPRCPKDTCVPPPITTTTTTTTTTMLLLLFVLVFIPQ